ncbi:MAG TPA: histidinol dehydrogenase [Alkalispirochaeta sp.]|nr:histidinol dehydrogenase [Alkalispirochaeta sp.]
MTVQVYRWSDASPDVKQRLLRRSQTDIHDLLNTVRPIVDQVRTEGDAALVRLTAQFDGAQVGELGITVRPEEFREAERSLDEPLRRALDYAIENVRTFHSAQVHRADQSVQVRPGIIATERTTPIDSVGLYVPSGRGSFPSMMYMLGVPAVLAGVETIAVTTPPRSDGTVDPAVLYAAASCGIQTVYRIGGAQAIAALAWGTETVPAVRKVVGPGSAYVAAAKRLVADQIDVGLPAGPSESIVVADADADPWVVALDLMIEAEHGSDSAALLVTSSAEVADRVQHHMSHILADVPEPRKTFLTDVFTSYGGIILTADEHQSAAVVNEFAPEHLLLHTRDPHATAAKITNASEILLGPHTAFSLANYATGPNAVLPTGGWAKTFGPVSVGDFQKSATVVEVTETGYAEMRDHVIRLADHEGFYTHAAALRERHRPQ